MSRCALVTSFGCEDLNWEDVWTQNKNRLHTFSGQKELCPETKREHWHFFIKFKDPKRKSGFQTLIQDDTANVQFKNEMNGKSEEHMFNYTQKPESYIGGRFSYGTKVSQGERTDLKMACNKILETGDLSCLIDENPSLIVKYHKGFEKLITIAKTTEKRHWEMDVRIYFGKSGTGKTRAVYDEFGGDIYSKAPDTKWWDGYKGETCVLIDEFDPATNSDYFSINLMKRLLDRYPFEVEVKGGTLNFCSKVIIFTTNTNPYQWWRDGSNEDCNAIKRRIQTWKRYE